MSKLDKNIEASARLIREKAPDFKPKTAIMLGSGLDSVSDQADVIADIPYTDLPGFPRPSVKGHAGILRLGIIDKNPVIFMKGRQHLYEGQGTDGLKVMIRAMKRLGIKTLFLTNATGGLKKEFNVGSLVAITGHLNQTNTNPLIGPNDDRWGERFLDQTDAWNKRLLEKLFNAAASSDICLKRGVYAQMLGPTFETPPEVKMLQALGADLVGMSTVMENIIANHCGLKCVGVSVVSNLGAGMTDQKLSHEQTLAGVEKGAKNMARLVRAFINSPTPP